MSRPLLRRRLATALIAVVSGLAATAATAQTVDTGIDTATTPFTARFDVNKAGLPLGSTQFTLADAAATDGRRCFVYHGQAKPNALVHLFLGDIDERSRFCVVNGQIRPMRFSHSEKDKPKKSYTLVFDWDSGQARYSDKAGRDKTFAIQPGVQDPLSLQIAARARVATAMHDAGQPEAEMQFRLADDDGVEDFTLTVRDGGTVETGAGRYDTLRVARSGKHSHTLVLWLARSEHFIPVQVQTGSDGTTFTMQAQSVTTGS